MCFPNQFLSRVQNQICFTNFFLLFDVMSAFPHFIITFSVNNIFNINFIILPRAIAVMFVELFVEMLLVHLFTTMVETMIVVFMTVVGVDVGWDVLFTVAVLVVGVAIAFLAAGVMMSVVRMRYIMYNSASNSASFMFFVLQMFESFTFKTVMGVIQTLFGTSV